MAYIYDLSDAWNAAGTTFTAIKMNVTNTASFFDSNLIDLQVGGTSQFRVRSNGDTFNRSLNASVAVYCSIGWVVGQNGGMSIAGTTGGIYFTPTANSGSAADLAILRDAANTLAQRNGVNAQAFNLYNTYTDASNYERGFMRFVSNVLEIGTQAAGTGTNRGVTIKAGTNSWVLDASVGTTSFPNSISLGGSANIQGIGGSTILFGTRGLVEFPADGVARFSRSFGAGFERIVFQDSTSAGASLKRSTTSLQARLGDDSAFTNIQGKLTTDTAYTAGVTTPTGYIVLFDSAGTAYKVPAEAL